ncbi:MAG: Stk1 family PASTA domain-containing Ser/Thr kinase [Corynebacteriales bacterium]|nr:Stk1 family PASTA domain-containing Ser/Thr kinase [Mycobacteriales bacterium]
MNSTRVLGGRYQLGELLGYGGMAEVHRGHDQRLGRDVAVKVLRADLARDSGFQERFRREGQNAASLNHPAIVAVYDTGEEETPDGPLPYIVMEYVEGRTLKEVLTAEGPIMPQRAMEIVADVCSALDFSHRNGIVHRDIKPANVMLTRTGAVKVMDFGIARALASATAAMTQTSAVIGTAQYLSPEQARGESVDARSDVYSTGCLLYELLVGHPPFTGDNPVSVAYQHVREDPVPPAEINRDVTPEMDSVVLKAMAKNPINRYQSAGEMRTDLLRAAAGHPVTAPMVMSAEERTHLLPRADRTGVIHPDRYDDLPLDAEDKKRGKAKLWVAGILVALLLFAGVAWATSKLLNDNTPKVTVPSVMGQSFAEAQDRLENLGLTAQRKDVESSAEDKDKVIKQNPDSGREVEKGSSVELEVGLGPDSVPMPDLKGLTEADARQALTDAGITEEPNVERVESSAAKGTVVDFSPRSESPVPKNQVVTIEVSDGSLVKVPGVVGQQAGPAGEILQGQGLRVTEREVASDKPAGTVVAQNPQADEEVARNSMVTLDVSRGGSTPSPSKTPSSSPSPTPSPTSTMGLP